MRHLKSGKKLGVTKSHRKAMLSNMAVSLFEHKKIKTTFAKAKELRRFADRMVTFGKKDTVAARRHVYKFIRNHKIVKILFDEIAPTFSEREGGYTRVLKLGNRPGDGSEMAIIELVGFHKSAKKKKKKEKGEKKKEVEKDQEVVEEQELDSETEVEEEEEVKEKKPAKKKAEKKVEEKVQEAELSEEEKPEEVETDKSETVESESEDDMKNEEKSENKEEEKN